MYEVRGCRTVVLLIVLITPTVLHTQALGVPPAREPPALASETLSPSQASTMEPAEEIDEAPPEVHADFAVAIDGSGLIDLDSQGSGHLMFGTAISAGWDSNPQNQGASVSTALYTVEPYIGFRKVSQRTRAIAQYQYTNTSFGAAYARQGMHLGSLHLQRSHSDRWSWAIDAAGRYGQDAVRFIGSPQTVAVGEVPGTSPNSAAYLPNAGAITYVEDALSVTVLTSQRDSLDLRIGDVFSRYQGFSGSNSIATSNFSYQHAVSPTLGVIAYQQNSFYSGSITCQSFGGGVGLHWKPRERTTISVSGGPQLDTASCGSQQGFAYNAALSSQLTGRSQIYLLSGRQPTSSYLGPGLWQQSVTGGYQRQVRSKGQVSFDVGYVASSTLVQLASYHGTYFDCVYGFRLGHGLRTSTSYRGYVGNSGGQPFNRNFAQVSLAWTPDAEHHYH